MAEGSVAQWVVPDRLTRPGAIMASKLQFVLLRILCSARYSHAFPPKHLRLLRNDTKRWGASVSEWLGLCLGIVRQGLVGCPPA